ncbi:hypothetical protein CDQ85_07570, partial [Clostridium thermosuccinogenes]
TASMEFTFAKWKLPFQLTQIYEPISFQSSFQEFLNAISALIFRQAVILRNVFRYCYDIILETPGITPIILLLLFQPDSPVKDISSIRLFMSFLLYCFI